MTHPSLSDSLAGYRCSLTTAHRVRNVTCISCGRRCGNSFETRGGRNVASRPGELAGRTHESSVKQPQKR